MLDMVSFFVGPIQHMIHRRGFHNIVSDEGYGAAVNRLQICCGRFNKPTVIPTMSKEKDFG